MENIGPQDFFYSGIIFASGYFLFFNSLLYLPGLKNPVALTGGLNLFLISYLMIYAGIVKSGYIFSLPWLFGSDIPVTSLTFISMIMNASLNSLTPLKWKRKYWIIFIFPLYMFSVWIINLYFDFNQQSMIVKKSIQHGSISRYYDPFTFSVYILMHGFVSVFYMHQLVKSFRLKKVSVKQIPLVVMGGTVLFAGIFFMSSFQMRNVFSVILPWSLSAAEFALFYALSFLFFIFFQTFPYLFKHGAVFFDARSFHIDRYWSPVLSGTNLVKVSEMVSATMLEKKTYLDEEITMPIVAGEIGISSHEFSAYLNQFRNQNFSEFLNSYRIQEAKAILKKSKDVNILKLSYDVGYNNPSTFYRAFKKETGLSPKEWKNTI